MPKNFHCCRLAAILCRKYRVPSEPRSQAASGGVSTGVGDHFGTLRAAGFFFSFFSTSSSLFTPYTSRLSIPWHPWTHNTTQWSGLVCKPGNRGRKPLFFLFLANLFLLRPTHMCDLRYKKMSGEKKFLGSTCQSRPCGLISEDHWRANGTNVVSLVFARYKVVV